MRLALAYARERWRLDHRIVRTRRTMLRALEERFPDRHLEECIEYRPSAGEIELAHLLDQLPSPMNDAQSAWCAILQRIVTTTPTICENVFSARLRALEEGISEDDIGFAAAWNSDPGPAEEAELLRIAPRACSMLVNSDSSRSFDEIQWLERALDATRAWVDVDGLFPARHKAVISWLTRNAQQDSARKYLVFEIAWEGYTP